MRKIKENKKKLHFLFTNCTKTLMKDFQAKKNQLAFRKMVNALLTRNLFPPIMAHQECIYFQNISPRENNLIMF